MQPTTFKATSAYLFVSLTAEQVAYLRDAIDRVGRELGIIGLVILGHEGLNATVAGSESSLSAFKVQISKLLERESLNFKDSEAKPNSFKRLKVTVRDEIVTTGTEVSPINEPKEHIPPLYLSPAAWHERISKGEKITLLDTRNDYELAIGCFRGAINPQLKNFSQFPEYVATAGLPKDKPVYMYCTGGIRCEKAALEMRRQGFREVYQLQGGILKYLEEFPNELFEGECFVFDNRAAVDQELKPSTRYSFCPHCGDPTEISLTCRHCGKTAKVCERCQAQPEKQTCSKNCAYQWKFRNDRNRVTDNR